jgi:drug/metabolite transporter (DMT)-like permease
MFAALLTPILFSLSVVCGHRSAKLIGGTEANFWRLCVAGVLLGAWAFGAGVGLSGVAFPLLVLSGIVGIGVGDVAFFQALPRLGSRLALLLIECLAPPIGALIEWMWLGTTLTVREVVFGLIILGGVSLALGPEERLNGNLKQWVLGTLFSLLAAAGGAGGAVLSRKAYVLARESAEQIDGPTAAFQRVVGGLLLAGICLLVVKRREFKVQARAPRALIGAASRKKWRGVWFWVLANGVAGMTLGVSCMQWALQTVPTGIVLSIIAMTPIVVIPFSVALEGERPTFLSLIGGGIAVAGVIALVVIR